MKFVIALISVGCCFIALTKGLTPEEKTELENKLLGDCKDKEKASDDDVKTLMDRALPTTPTGKCLLACVHETIGLIKDGKPSIEGAVSIAKIEHAGNEKAVEMANKLMNDCAELSDSNRCELATKIMQCGQQSAVKYGLDPKKLI